VTIQLVLADEHPLMLDGLARLFASERDMTVVAQTGTADDALHAVARHRADVLVMDVRLRGIRAADVLRQVARDHPTTAVAVYTAAVTRSEMLEVVRLGVRGIVLKEMPPRFLVNCVRAIHAGRYWLEKDLATQAVEALLRHQAGARRLGHLLSDREIEIASAVAGGLRNRAIADRLNISEGTVKAHLHNIYRKVGVDGRHALVAYATEHGLL
jgi:DNA-binding NarL/FixJ family response regulator